MKERTLAILKPDTLSKKCSGDIISVIESSDLQIIGIKMCSLTEEEAGEFYKEHCGKDFCRPLIKFMISNPVIVMVLEGDDAISNWRKMIGATDPSKAEEGTIRKRWAMDGRHNAVHGSDSPSSAEREIAFFFKGHEIFSWEPKLYKL